MELRIENIGDLMVPEARGRGVERRSNQSLWIRDGWVVWSGPAADLPSEAQQARSYDCLGGAVLPALIDSHTHLAFVGDRITDFTDRAAGVSYAEIASRGGGIATTVGTTRAASFETLLEQTRARLDARRRYGIATTEIKSGYGLERATELRQLEVIAELRRQGYDVEATFLGAHSVPRGVERTNYLDLLVERLIPEVAERRLATFIDVFVERGAFSADEARTICQAGRAHGLRPRLHVDQLSDGGGAALAAELSAISADHLEHAHPDGLAALAAAGVIGTLLPGAWVYLGEPPRKLGAELRAAGVELAIATDQNPGSSPLANLPLAATLAVTLLGVTVDEALRAITLGAAHALGRSDIGSLERGYRARLLVLNHADARSLLYAYGEPTIRAQIDEHGITAQG